MENIEQINCVPKNSITNGGDYVCMCVTLDVTQPLCRKLIIALEKEGAVGFFQI